LGEGEGGMMLNLDAMILTAGFKEAGAPVI